MSRINGREVEYIKCSFNKEDTVAAGFEEKILRDAKEYIEKAGGEYCRGPEMGTRYLGNDGVTIIDYTVIYYKEKLN